MDIPKGVIIALGILVILSIILICNKNEGFTVVEDDVDKIINIQDTLNDLLLGDHYRVFMRK